MKLGLRIALTGLAAGTLFAALVAAAVPLWLVFRVPGVITSPEPDAY